MHWKTKVAGVYNNLTVKPKHCIIEEQAQKGNQFHLPFMSFITNVCPGYRLLGRGIIWE